MRIGYYCPLAGSDFFRSFGIEAVDLRHLEYKSTDILAQYNCSSDKCNMSCCMLNLLDSYKNHGLDCIVLTNCCHEQEELVDYMAAHTDLPVLTLNIPRKNTKTDVVYFAKQLEILIGHFNRLSNKNLESNENGFTSAETFSADDKNVGIMISGITIPLWINKALENNGWKSILIDTCSIEPFNQKWIHSIKTYYQYAQYALNHSRCFRRIDANAHELIDIKMKESLPKAGIYFSNEYCTTAVYGYAIFKDLCRRNNLESFKITISNWNQPTDDVINQIEVISQIIRGEI